MYGKTATGDGGGNGGDAGMGGGGGGGRVGNRWFNIQTAWVWS